MAWYLLTLRPRPVTFLGPGKLPLLIDDSAPGVSSRNVMPALLNCAIACEVVIGHLQLHQWRIRSSQQAAHRPKRISQDLRSVNKSALHFW